jgi:deoxycytidylate deaminase
VVDVAIAVARESKCQKSKRGAVIWNPTQGSMSPAVYGRNTPPNDHCDGSKECREHCAQRCVHAETAAIAKAAAEPKVHPLKDCQIVHVKVVDGELVPSGPPSCMECAKLIAAVQINSIWLYHDSGWERYTAARFLQETVRTLDIY